jgi:hypothetical protein
VIRLIVSEHVASPVAGARVDNPVTRDRHGRWCQEKKWMWSFLSHLKSAPAVSSRLWGTIRSHSGIKSWRFLPSSQL